MKKMQLYPVIVAIVEIKIYSDLHASSQCPFKHSCRIDESDFSIISNSNRFQMMLQPCSER